jgi:flagellar basal-body rod protein FlgB
MTISQIPIFSMLRTRMQWHQERQRILAENVANADTPQFRPRDLMQPKFDKPEPAASLILARTTPGHMSASTATNTAFELDRKGIFEARPSGNAVNLEDQMLKVSANNMDYQTVTALYTRGLGLIKTAIGKK